MLLYISTVVKEVVLYRARERLAGSEGPSATVLCLGSSCCSIADGPLESRLFSRLRELGYRLFHLEPNYFDPGHVAEVAWIHESLLLSKLEGAKLG